MSANDRVSVRSTIPQSELIAALQSTSTHRRIEALKDLARGKTPGIDRILEGVARDEAQPRDARSVAIVQLEKLLGAGADSVLVELLQARDNLVVRRAAEALGRVGGKSTLRELERLREPENETTRRSVDFARTLLSARQGRATHPLATPHPGDVLPVDPSRSRRLEIKRPSATYRGQSWSEIQRYVRGVELDQENVVELRCGRNSFLLFVNPSAAEIAEAAIAGVVVKKSPAVATMGLHLYLLMQRDAPDHAQLFGVRPSGHVTHFGTATRSDETITFRIGALNTVYSPAMAVEGVFDVTRRQLLLSSVVVQIGRDDSRVRPMSPRRLEPELPIIKVDTAEVTKQSRS